MTYCRPDRDSLHHAYLYHNLSIDGTAANCQLNKHRCPYERDCKSTSECILDLVLRLCGGLCDLQRVFHYVCMIVRVCVRDYVKCTQPPTQPHGFPGSPSPYILHTLYSRYACAMQTIRPQ
jgi:hypothetical protein